MARLKREDLKCIVKECLVEILQEGLSGESSSNVQVKNLSESKIRGTSQSVKPRVNRKSLDSISYGKTSRPEDNVNENFERNIDNVANSLTDDPVLSSIFKDTATTTLQNQMMAESSRHRRGAMPPSNDPIVKAVEASTPAELFGDSASKWADLAFSTPVSKS